MDPLFGWRGLSLDVARSFFGVLDVELVLDLMASLKLNVMHLHLSDDQGWRIEVPGWPQLTELSGPTAVDGNPGGYFSRADWDRLVAHAHRLGIAVVPEIDVPGHVNAALHAVPGLNPTGVAAPPYGGIEVGFSTLSPPAPEIGRFLQEVLGYACELSGGWVHIGGDESHAIGHDDYLSMVKQAVAIVHRRGCRVVAWQEAAEALEPGDIVQVWDERLDFGQVRAAAERGVRVLLSPATRVYLDQKYHEGFPLGLSWAGTFDLREAFEWDPFEIVADIERDSVIGIEACLWTETIRSTHDLTMMLLPRLAAVAEIAWRGSGIGRWDSFVDDVTALSRGWDARRIAWYRSPGIDWAGPDPIR